MANLTRRIPVLLVALLLALSLLSPPFARAQTDETIVTPVSPDTDDEDDGEVVTPEDEGDDAEAPENGGNCPQECCFKFQNVEVPQLVYPEAQPNSIGDHTLNVNNSLVNADGSVIYGCNGFRSEYFDEDLGEWTSNWTGSDNVTRDLIDVFYATGDTLFNVRTIQTFMDPDLQLTLANRLVRTAINCSNGETLVESCVQFTISGEGSNFTCAFQDPGGCVPVVEAAAAEQADTAAAIGAGVGVVGFASIALCMVVYWRRRERVRKHGPLSAGDLAFVPKEKGMKNRRVSASANAGAGAAQRPEGVKTLLNRIQKEGTLTAVTPPSLLDEDAVAVPPIVPVGAGPIVMSEQNAHRAERRESFEQRLGVPRDVERAGSVPAPPPSAPAPPRMIQTEAIEPPITAKQAGKEGPPGLYQSPTDGSSSTTMSVGVDSYPATISPV